MIFDILIASLCISLAGLLAYNLFFAYCGEAGKETPWLRR